MRYSAPLKPQTCPCRTVLSTFDDLALGHGQSEKFLSSQMRGTYTAFRLFLPQGLRDRGHRNHGKARI